jgi:hypothetical protein
MEREEERGGEGMEEEDDVGSICQQVERKRGSKANLDHMKIQRPVSGPKSIKYVHNGTSQAKNEL